ncbi:MAG: Lrp/AsnC ligand binding domain-containing protein [Desulfobacterales bacterium]|nr:Lrp/AsnC ligand binding domain-containing protein [Desulfobacterales bacterium]
MIIASGRFDIFAEVVCRDHEHLLRFITEKLSTIDGVREIRIVHALEDRKRDLLLGYPPPRADPGLLPSENVFHTLTLSL